MELNGIIFGIGRCEFEFWFSRLGVVILGMVFYFFGVYVVIMWIKFEKAFCKL